MPRYYLHLRDGTDEVLDPEGMEMAVDAIPGAALNAARDCMAADVKNGVLDLRFRIEVHGDDDELVHGLRFADAIRVVSPA
jgi:hypothetical protein